MFAFSCLVCLIEGILEDSFTTILEIIVPMVFFVRYIYGFVINLKY
jgi:hypothetical protein